jgi:4-amino-4-deoxy-L-arabinose transferase-like glycosyltransferase
LTYRDIGIAVGIVLFAYFLRVVVVFDRAYGDPFFDPLPAGRDQLAYMTFAEEYEAGQWPTEPFRYQPGFVYYLVGIRALVGKSLGVIRLVTSLMGALACGFMAGGGWLLTGRKWGGYLAGLLMAIYPVAIFYSTVLLTEPLATFLVSLWLFLVLWQHRPYAAVARSAIIGLSLGLLAITRTNLLLLWFAWLLVLDWRTPGGQIVSHQGVTEAKVFNPRRLNIRRQAILHAAISFLCMALVIAPVTLWNIRSGEGEFQLITSTGMDEVYRANNRDATGVRSGDPAMETVDDGYDHALVTDILRNPLRFIELQLRKAGIYWSAQEPINNIDYVASGEAVSPLLRAIPLDFGILTLLGWIGTIALFYDDKRLGAFFAITHLLIFAGVMVIWVEGRLKQPAVVPLVAASAYLIVRLSDLIRQRHILARRYAPAALALLVLFLYLDWARANLPAKRPVASLPADLRLLDVVFDGQLRLLGWRTLPEWPAPARGWSPYLRSYVIELFWQLDAPVTEDYNVYIAYVDGGERYAGVDRAIGAVSFRPKTTSQWQPGDIYSEILGFRLPFTIPPARSGDIRLGVYLLEEGSQQAIVNVPATSLDGQPETITLQRLAVFDFNRPVSVPEERTASNYVFGQMVALSGYSLPERAQPNETVTLSFSWEAVAEIPADYTTFIHVMDERDQLAVQLDRPPLLATSTWPPDYPVHDMVSLAMPPTPGVYRVYMGLYDALTGERLAVDAPDYRPLLGQITVND